MKATETIKKLCRWLLVIIFALMFIATFAQVIFRYFFSYPLGWTEEFSRIMFVWSAFLATGFLAIEDRLMYVELFISKVPPRPRRVINIMIKVLSGITFSWLGVLGVRMLGLTRYQLSSALRIPYWLIYLALPVGMFIAGFAMFVQAYELLTNKERSVERC